MSFFKPLSDRVLVKKTEAEEKSPGGIFIPENFKEKPVQGTVIAVGPGKRDRDGRVAPLAVSPGDVVLFGKHTGTKFKHDGQEYLIMREEEILSTVLGE